MRKHSLCPNCGTRLCEYRFGFNRGLAKFLYELYSKRPEPVRTDSLDLTYSERTNSQKLRYWNLAHQWLGSDESRHKRGWWMISQTGIDFVEGICSIAKYAVTVKGSVVRHEGPLITFESARGGWLHHGDYTSGTECRD